VSKFLVLYKLQPKIFLLAILVIEQDKFYHWVARYHWKNNLLFQMWPNRAKNIILRLDYKTSLVQHVHEELGHFEVCKIHYILQN